MPGKLFIFSGSDDDAVKEAAGRFVRKLCGGQEPEANPSLEIIQGDVDSESAGQVLDTVINTISTPPFLTPDKIVWVKHFNKFEEAYSEPSDKKRLSRIDTLGSIFKAGLMENVTVILDGPGMDRKRAFYKTCAAICKEDGNALEWFDKLDPKARGFEAGIAKRAAELAEREGKKLTQDAAQYLAKSVGGDLPRMRNEIFKLACYAGDRDRINLNDCKEVCTSNQDTLSWEFSSALAERDRVKALELIPGIIRTLQQGTSSGSVPELAIVGAVANEFKRILSVKCEGARLGIPANTGPNYFENLAMEQQEKGIKSILLNMHPYRAYKMWCSAARFKDAEFADIFDAIARTNRTIVTGGDARIALEKLVLSIA